MANPFTDVKVFPNFATGHVVQWSIDPVFRGEEPFDFLLEISETPDFSELITFLDAGESFFAVDKTNIKQEWSESYIYRVKLTTADDKVYYSRQINIFANQVEARKYLMAAEISRKEFVRMSFVGREGWVLKRKGYSQVSQQLLDPVSGVPLTDTPVDYGTGLEGGYHSPLKIYYTEEACDFEVNLDPNGLGTTETNQVNIRMVGFPFIDVKDILVNDNDERYVVWKVDEKVFPGTDIVLIQNAVLHRIAPSDSIYQIQVIT